MIGMASAVSQEASGDHMMQHIRDALEPFLSNELQKTVDELSGFADEAQAMMDEVTQPAKAATSAFANLFELANSDMTSESFWQRARSPSCSCCRTATHHRESYAPSRAATRRDTPPRTATHRHAPPRRSSSVVAQA